MELRQKLITEMTLQAYPGGYTLSMGIVESALNPKRKEAHFV